MSRESWPRQQLEQLELEQFFCWKNVATERIIKMTNEHQLTTYVECFLPKYLLLQDNIRSLQLKHD